MREFIHSLKFKIIVCVFALLFGFMIYAAASSNVSLPEAALRTVTSPFARLSSSISNFVKNNADKIVNADKYKNENEQLRRVISDLHKQIVDIDELIIDNGLLREMLDIMAENPDFEWPNNTCTISSWNANDIFRGFTINRGSDDGISLQDLVITKIGVVGIVTSVAPNYAGVSTILAPETEIGVLTTRSNVQGILQNDILYSKDGLCRISHIKSDADIKEGDIIITMGTITYPPGQIIGEVIKVFDDPNGLSRHALVKPSENLSGLTNVLVVTNFEGKEQIQMITDDENNND
ncbi:MAG: rod shape-determining protein MreC [Oscillospiraceae bacterium]|nr:rod shape-determining protein MreC [Oscillospiraceae bacterium]